MSQQEEALSLPPVPDDIREAGRLAPDHWLGVVDPMWSGEGKPPQWAMTGRWRSGLDGEIVEWEDNPDYRPSPRTLGWPGPEDEVDRAVQLASTGYGPGEAVPAALAGREVAVLTAPGGGLVSATATDGTPVVPVFTSSVFLHAAGRYAFELIGVENLLARVPEGHVLYLNPSAAVSMLLDPEAVRDVGVGELPGGPGVGVGELPGGPGVGVGESPAVPDVVSAPALVTEAVQPVRGSDA